MAIGNDEPGRQLPDAEQLAELAGALEGEPRGGGLWNGPKVIA